MQWLSQASLLFGMTLAALLKLQLPGQAPTQSVDAQFKTGQTTCQHAQKPDFLVMGGGGAPSYNEIAIEKNVLYFQRTLQALGYGAADASVFFANGNDGQSTIRYVDRQKRERFKAPEVPNLMGAATLTNLQGWMQQTAKSSAGNPLFFYFTGHGTNNRKDLNDNFLILWGEDFVSVKQFARLLDQLPPQKPVVTMMAQCYSGAFANLIYQGGDPKRSVALQTRCGFFATIKELPSIGCTPEVNEADYRDYSSSFFAGLSGRSRIGQLVASADYNQDGHVAYNEAHAFAKVDEQGIDLPISTSEAWLRNRVSKKAEQAVLNQPISSLMQSARPDQRYVVASLTQMFGFNPQGSFTQNLNKLDDAKVSTNEQQTYMTRLWLELVNIGAEKQLRATRNQKQIAILDRLLNCESGFWGSRR